MPKMRTWILIVAGALAVAAVAWTHRAADVAAWPRYEYFRCQTCAGPASIDPTMPERWGCPACGFSTYDLPERFRVASRADIYGEPRFSAAELRAGVISDNGCGTPVVIWSAAGGDRHVTAPTPASACRLGGDR